MRSWIDRFGIELRGGGRDESPDCYKRLDEVLAEVSDSVRVPHSPHACFVSRWPQCDSNPGDCDASSRVHSLGSRSWSTE